MRVRVEEHLFDCNDREVYRALRRLFELAVAGKHALADLDRQRVEASEFFREARAEMERMEWQELVERAGFPEMYASSAEREGRYVLVSLTVIEAPEGAVLVPPRALRSWLDEPLRVLLENQRDGVLIHLAAGLARSDRLVLALKEGWLRLDGCGGSGEVKNAVDRAETLARLFIIVDSDREEPNGEESPMAHRIKEAATTRRFPVHVLERRELENYVPDEIWERLVGRERRSHRRSRTVDPRVGRVHRWLVGQIEKHRSSLERWHSKKAVDHVAAGLRREAQKDVSNRSLRDALAELRAMPAATRAVDDMKVRFGESLAQTAIAKMSSQDFEGSRLDPDAQRELGLVAARIEEIL